MKYPFTVTDRYGKELHILQWLPDDSEPRAVVQISHGMAEHSGRYHDFAQFLTRHGLAVFSHDHRGHGKTDPDHLGYIPEGDGFQLQVENIEDVKQEIVKQYKHLPRILFGHSMGSFLVQRHMQISDDRPNGIIYSGSNGRPPFFLPAGIFLSKLLRLLQGDNHPSKLIRDITFVPYNQKFKPTRTEKDWLSRDPDAVDDYINDPIAGFIASTSFFHEFFKGLYTLHRHKPFTNHSSDIPILLISGARDPVGQMGEGVHNLAELLKKSGSTSVSLNLYSGARHELLNEINKEEVKMDVLTWIEQHALVS